MAWRRWFIDIPATLTDVGLAWYRLYLVFVLGMAAFVLPAFVIASLLLYFGFNIRWGW